MHRFTAGTISGFVILALYVCSITKPCLSETKHKYSQFSMARTPSALLKTMFETGVVRAYEC